MLLIMILDQYPNYYKTLKIYTGYFDSLDVMILFSYARSIAIKRDYCTSLSLSRLPKLPCQSCSIGSGNLATWAAITNTAIVKSVSRNYYFGDQKWFRKTGGLITEVNCHEKCSFGDLKNCIYSND